MILDVDGIAFDYKSTEVLKGIDFTLKKNEMLTILGPNGVGKTTLLKCINAILQPKQGSVMIEGLDLMKLDKLDVAKKLGYVPQRCETGRLTAFDAILLGRTPHIRWNVSDKDLKMVDAIIKKLEMQHLSLKYIDEMSGGELQKVSIARAIVQESRVLLLDEPTSSLDLKNQLEILSILKEIVRGHNVSLIMTMHDLNTALRVSDSFLFLKNGVIHAAGGPEIVTPEVINEVYGVPVYIEKIRGIPIVLPLEV